MTACFLLCSTLISAQSVTDEIDRDVWHPFIYTYDNFKADSFMSIHTHDVVRVGRDGGRMLVGPEYAESVNRSCQRGIENEAQRSIEFTFEQRLNTDDSAFEVGYYRVIYAEGGQQQVSYGKFTVLLKKVDGKWKIAVDSDTSREGAIREEHFMSGTPLKGI